MKNNNLLEKNTESTKDNDKELNFEELLELRMNSKVLVKTRPGVIETLTLAELDKKLGYDKLRQALSKENISEDDIIEEINKAVIEYYEKTSGQKVITSNINKMKTEQEVKDYIQKDYMNYLMSDVEVSLGKTICTLRVIDVNRINSCITAMIFGLIWTAMVYFFNFDGNMIMLVSGNLINIYLIYNTIQITLSGLDRLLNN